MTTDGDRAPERDDAPLPVSDAAAAAVDPVVARREQIGRMVKLGQNVGYGLFGLFAVLVVVAFVTGFPTGVAIAATVSLIAGCVVLAPAIVFGYAVKAADRADREDDWR